MYTITMMLASAGVDERGESPTHSASGRSLSLQSAGARQNGGTNERDSSMSPAALAAPAVAEQVRWWSVVRVDGIVIKHISPHRLSQTVSMGKSIVQPDVYVLLA